MKTQQHCYQYHPLACGKCHEESNGKSYGKSYGKGKGESNEKSIRDRGCRMSLSLGASLAIAALNFGAMSLPSVAVARSTPATRAQSQLSCQVNPTEATEKETLRQAVLQGDSSAIAPYQAIVRRHAQEQANCRQASWPKERAIWLNLYPCDVEFGQIDEIFDQIANAGYSQVYLTTLGNGQILLPQSDNPTPWPSLVRSSAYKDVDMLANAMTAGRARGMTVKAWMFAINVGYAYGDRADRQEALGKNGLGETSRDRLNSVSSSADGVFIDPYSPIAQQDYQTALREILQRDPDGVVLDYVRYPRLTGTESIADNVRDLWVYGTASRSILLDRALNPVGRDLLEQYLTAGRLTDQQITQTRQRYNNAEPRWQGTDRYQTAQTTQTSPSNPTDPASQIANPSTNSGTNSSGSSRGGNSVTSAAPSLTASVVNAQLWHLSVAHAAQGIVDFVAKAAATVEASGKPVGAAFFPNGNIILGNGFDSRLQPWDQFPRSITWHPMMYDACSRTDCIVDDFDRLAQFADDQTEIIPAIAGVWGETFLAHPPLEAQMAAIRQANPAIDAISHFSFGWQNPEFDNQRKFCRLPN